MSGDKKQTKQNGNTMSKQHHLQAIDTWTQPRNLKPLPFWQALAVHLTLCLILTLPFMAALGILYAIIAP